MNLIEKYKSINVAEFDYPLNDERIAKHPISKRGNSKLLVYKEKDVYRSSFSSIENYLDSGDLLVFNNTKVVQARLKFTKSTGATIEIFLLNPVNPSEYNVSFSSQGQVQWNCIVGNIKRWKNEMLNFAIPHTNIVLKATMIERTSDGALVKFAWNQDVAFAQIIELCGEVPIPPYLNRAPIADDITNYQTVYAKPEGSVAAPTAGLHFTTDILKKLRKSKINIGEITLHVGAGTFRPVKSDEIGGHEMHQERIYVSKELIEKLLNSNGRKIAVGTTSMRTLESLYWLGVKLLENNQLKDNFKLNQWDCYHLNSHYKVNESLQALLQYINRNGLKSISAITQLIIVPGYRFRIVDVLITNFHQPRSTLLLLVAAFIGDDWKRVYDYALKNDFRFLSYGDSSILFKH
jgi:S-adenosylmethionine:tRNA ribosyltransferase-isomerase